MREWSLEQSGVLAVNSTSNATECRVSVEIPHPGRRAELGPGMRNEMIAESDSDSALVRQRCSERFLATLAPFPRIVLVSHVNPDPDALASMLGLRALLAERQP